MAGFYIKHYLEPQFESLGKDPVIMGSRYIDIFGKGINIGNYPTFVATDDSRIRLTTWNVGGFDGKIYAGDFCLFSPGVRIAAATEIRIGKQIHSWGSTDGNSPVDNLNANDYYYLFE